MTLAKFFCDQEINKIDRNLHGPIVLCEKEKEIDKWQIVRAGITLQNVYDASLWRCGVRELR